VAGTAALVSQGILVSFSDLNRPVQRRSGDFQCPANFRNRVLLLVEIKGNLYLFASQHFRSAAFLSSGTGSYKTCCCSFSDEVSLKLPKSTIDMKD
jgi:hypothetical protein